MRLILFCLIVFLVNIVHAQGLSGKYKITKFDILEDVTLHDTLMSMDSLQWINFKKSAFDSINIVFRDVDFIDVISSRYKATILFTYPYKNKKEKNRNIKIDGSSFRQFQSAKDGRSRFRSVIEYMYGVIEIFFIDDSKIELLGYRYPYKYKIFLERE